MKIYQKYALTLLFSAFTVALTACTNSNISAVKNQPALHPDYTFGQTLDERQICKSTDWDVIKASNGRDMVVYYCTFKISSEVLQQAKEASFVSLQGAMDGILGRFNIEKKEYERRIRLLTDTHSAEKASQFRALQERIQEEQERLVRVKAQNPDDKYSRVFKKMSRSDAEKAIREEIAETQAALARLAAEVVALEEQKRGEENRLNTELAEVQAELAKLEAKRISVATQLQAMVDEPKKRIDEAFKQSNVYKHKILFQFSQGKWHISAQKFIINDKEQEGDFSGMPIFIMALVSPDNKFLDSEWHKWLVTVLTLNGEELLAALPYVCNVEKGCVKKSGS